MRHTVANAEEEIKMFVNSPGARLQTVEGGQHYLSAGHSEVVDNALMEFVDKYSCPHCYSRQKVSRVGYNVLQSHTWNGRWVHRVNRASTLTLCCIYNYFTIQTLSVVISPVSILTRTLLILLHLDTPKQAA